MSEESESPQEPKVITMSIGDVVTYRVGDRPEQVFVVPHAGLWEFGTNGFTLIEPDESGTRRRDS